MLDKHQVRRILVITLSNVGDIILTTPVIRVLSREFAGRRIDVMTGPNGRPIFEKDPRIFKLIIYDKHSSVGEKRRLQLKLRKLRYDLIVDLRNTVFPILLSPKYRTSTIQSIPKNIVHKKRRHLYRLISTGIQNIDADSYIYIPEEDEEYVDKLIGASGITGPVVVINAGAKSHLKRWGAENFAELADRLRDECRTAVVFTGLREDRDVADMVMGKMKGKFYDLVEKTNIRQLASLLKKSALLITNDSAPLHAACAVGAKVLAIFGPTDPKKYGPTGEFDVVINKKLFCSPCESASCKYGHECMKLISVDEVFDAAKIMVEGYG